MSEITFIKPCLQPLYNYLITKLHNLPHNPDKKMIEHWILGEHINFMKNKDYKENTCDESKKVNMSYLFIPIPFHNENKIIYYNVDGDNFEKVEDVINEIASYDKQYIENQREMQRLAIKINAYHKRQSLKRHHTDDSIDEIKKMKK